MKPFLLIVLAWWSATANAQPVPVDGGTGTPQPTETTDGGSTAPPATEAQGSAAQAEVTERAKALYITGSKHYDAGEFRAAVDSFRDAYRVLPDPLFLFNIAQAYRKLDDCDNARTHYRAYLRDEPAADNRAQVERLIATMDDCVAKRAQPAPSSRLRLAGLITAAAGVAVVGGGVYFSVDARQAANSVETQCAAGCSASEVAAADRRGLAAERNAIVMYSIGGAAIAAGVGMLIWARLTSSSHAIVTPTPGGGAVTVWF